MIELLKYILPSLIILVAVWIVMQKLFKSEQERRLFELKKNTQKEITPIRLRAYERLALFLERITPEHIVLDMDITEMNALQLQQHMLQTIRLEYEHNQSQQIYVSDNTWNEIVNAKEETLKFISTMCQEVSPTDSALHLASLLITTYNNNGETPVQHALLTLKDEARNIM